MGPGLSTLRVWVERYEGSGHRTASVFVQWLDVEREDASGARAYRELDVIESFAGAGIPFFAMGYPANLYDAPAHNLRGSTWMRWLATTWFVTLPARWTAFEVRPVVGFRWGYEEGAQPGGVTVLPMSDLSARDWDQALGWLRKACPGVSFAPA